MTTIGFMASGKFINDSFSDWEEEPIVTTLDSISAPVKELQFPTITVCPENYRPPDNWAALENILNLVAFECGLKKKWNSYNQNYEPETLPSCNSTLDIRHDFEYLLFDTLGAFIERVEISKTHLQNNPSKFYGLDVKFIESELIPHLASFLEKKALEHDSTVSG